MEEVKRIKLIRTQKLEDIPELIHHIQSLLPVEDAARTCVLSKSWLHAWSTNPNLRFAKVGRRQNIEYMDLIDRTIQRYFRDNISITSFQLMMILDDARSYSFVNKWIRQLVSKSCFTEVYLILYIYNLGFYFCDELFSSENLKKVNLHIRAPYKMSWRNPRSPITDSLASVTELCLDFMAIDKSVPDLLEYKFPFLESLNLKFEWCATGILDIKCVLLKRLIIKVRQQHERIRVQVFAPKLIICRYTGGVEIPSFVFSAIPKQVELKLKLTKPFDISFFLKLRETLSLSSQFKIVISCSCTFIKNFNIDIDDLRRQVPCLATNVQQLSFGACLAGKNGREKCPGKDLWAQSEFFDSLFSIFKPGYTMARRCIRPATRKILK